MRQRRTSGISLPLPDATCDVVLCQQGLQYFTQRAAALREMAMRPYVDDTGLAVPMECHVVVART
jgi:hypothetical protein